MSTVTLNGKDYQDTDFVNYGFKTVTTAGTGASLPRWQAMWVDGLVEVGNATTAAAAALASQTAAAGYAGAAAGSATTAAGHAARFLLPASSAPSTRDDDSALQAGDSYLNTSDDTVYVWSGSAWVATAIDPALYVVKTRSVSAGTGLTGGGDLSADRTLSVAFASQSEAEAGVATDKAMNALRVKQAVAAQVQPPGSVLIGTATASNDAAVDFVSGIDSTYRHYVLVAIDVVPANDGAKCQLLTSPDGSTFSTGATDYAYALTRVASAGTSNDTASGSDHIAIGVDAVGSDVNETGISFALDVFDPASASYTSVIFRGRSTGTAGAGASGGVSLFHGTGTRLSAAAVQGLRIKFTSGNIESGFFALYGVRAS